MMRVEIRSGKKSIPQVMTALRNTVVGLIRVAEEAHIAQGLFIL